MVAPQAVLPAAAYGPLMEHDHGNGNNNVIDFDNGGDVNHPLTGQFPDGVIDWGDSSWWLSGPYAQFDDKSVSFIEGVTSASFKFLSPKVLASLDADNGGEDAATVTLRCDGGSARSVTLDAGQVTTIATGWTQPCSQVTIDASNGWITNFTKLILQ